VHVNAQRQGRHLLQAAAGDSGVVETVMPYRPLPEYECWGADVAYVSNARWQSIEDWLLGAPELVVEVLSPADTASEVFDKRQTCLENGCLKFWVVDPKRQQVEV